MRQRTFQFFELVLRAVHFDAHEVGQLEHFRQQRADIVEMSEKENLFYGFSINGDEIFCREAYESAEGLLAPLDNVGALLEELLKVADIIRVEVHGPAEQLEKLKAPLAHLSPTWFMLEASRHE